jgi:CBS domain-containing protein
MIRVSDVMSKDIVFLSHDASAKEAARILLENGANSIVIEDRGQVLGIVTVMDLARVFLNGQIE